MLRKKMKKKMKKNNLGRKKLKKNNATRAKKIRHRGGRKLNQEVRKWNIATRYKFNQWCSVRENLVLFFQVLFGR